MKNKPLAISMLLMLFISTVAIVLPVAHVSATDDVLNVLFDQDVAWAHVKVEEFADSVKWTIDLNESSQYLNNPVAGIVVIIGIGSEIEFQIHNNDGVDPHYPYGTWLISYYESGWHTGSPDYRNYPLPDGITASGGRSKGENPQMIFTVTIGKSYLANEFKWAVYFKGGSGGRTFYPADFSWYDTNTSDMATAKYLILGGAVASLAKARGTSEQYYWGSGCWAAVLGQKFEIYIDPTVPPFDALGSFMIDNISSISYHTNKPGSQNDVDFYLVIYTKPDGVDDKASWYGYKLIGEPYFSRNPNAPSNQWNKWSTDVGTNQLTFFDPDTIGFYGFYGQPTLQDIQAGPINWHDYYSGCPVTNIDYGVEIVKYISFQTGTGWMNTFQGYIDAITIALKDGTTVSVDLEGFASEVWVDDDWAGLPPGYEVEPGKFIGYNAFAKIQDGVNAVAEGGTVHVYEGTYYENLVVSKALTIQGADKETTILQAQPVGYGDKAIEIKSSNVIISGFTISGYAPTETKPYYTYWGIYAYGSSTSHYTNIVVTDNIFTFLTQNGIQLGYVDGGLIANNIFKRETRLVWYDPPGPDPGSYINVTRGGSGPALWYCTNVIIDPNIIQTDGVGIFLYSSSNILIESNIISAPDTTNPSDVGIHIQSCTNIDIIGNTIQNFTAGPKQYYTWGTTGAGINVYVSKAVNIENNNLYSNTIGVLVQRLNLTTVPREVNIHYNNFEGNTEFGVLNCYNWVGKDKTYTPTNESFVVDARYNWWGHETGPYHGTSWTYMGSPYGPHYGLGDNVSDYVLYDPWLRVPFTPPPIHDVAIINVVASPSRAVVGTTIQVDVTVKNEGNTYETFDVSLDYNGTLIGTQTVTDMVPGSTKILSFSWSTMGVTPGVYNLTAVAGTVPGETDTADNAKWVKVKVGPNVPVLKVEPWIVRAQMVNKTFDVNVTINNLWQGWSVVSVQFGLSYNSTLLEVVNVTEGPFMKQFGGTSFVYLVEEPGGGLLAHVLVNVTLLPPWTTFPHESGVLATIKFKVVYQEKVLNPDLTPPLTCDLKLFGVNGLLLVDDEGERIPCSLEGGIYEIYSTHVCDVDGDYYVGISDILYVAEHFGAEPVYWPERWDPACDLNNDNYVGIADILLVASNFGWLPEYDP